MTGERPVVGEALPGLAIEVTATRVVAGAIATRDFMPVHHDRAYAESQGAPEIFLNIISTNAYCSRFLTDWAGPAARLTRLAIRLGLPAFAGATLTFTGTVAAVEVAPGGHHVEVELRAATDQGDHATGTATLFLPEPS